MTPEQQALIERFTKTEAGQKAAQLLEAEAHAARVKLRADIEQLRRERGEQQREQADAVAVAKQRMETARKELTATEHEYQNLCGAQAQTQASYDARIRKLENRLISSAPAAISSFLAWLDDQESEVKSTEICERSTATNRINTHTDKCVREIWSNAEGLRHRLAAIRSAKEEAERLRLRVMDTDALDQRLEELRSLPPVEMRLAYEA